MVPADVAYPTDSWLLAKAAQIQPCSRRSAESGTTVVVSLGTQE